MTSLFSSPKTPAPPVVAPTPVMPVADDEAAKQQKIKEASAAAQKSGRASTIMTSQTGEKLGD